MSGAPAHSRPAGDSAARTSRVLVVDDEADLRELLELTLVGMGLDVDCAADLAAARALLGRHRYALALTDMRLPDGQGLELVEELARGRAETPVAVITAYGSAENAVAALKAGAFDYLSKPVGLEALRALVRSALRLPERAAAADAARPDPRSTMVGDSPAMHEVRATVARLARSMAPVAVRGESGTGKELAARLIHELGPRASQPFVAVNCGAIPEPLMEAEFFGYRKGAFTGADQDRNGFFQAASGGTLFLDEVADLPLAMQVKLLRAIQEKRVRRVGATAEEPVDVRIVSATHQDLARCVSEGRFRQDLFYRLNVIELQLPPLRERREDIPQLAEAVIARLAARAGLTRAPRLASVTLRYLQSYAFPGNVRELENVLERALAFSDGEVINVEDLGLKPVVFDATEREPADVDLQRAARAEAVADAGRGSVPRAEPQHVRTSDAGSAAGAGAGAGESAGAGAGTRAGTVVNPGADAGAAGGSTAPAVPGGGLSEDGIPRALPEYLDHIERQAIESALRKTRFNRTAAARLLGISFRALRYRMQRLGIQ